MKHLKITVEGKQYDVMVEEINDDAVIDTEKNELKNISEKRSNNQSDIKGEPINAPMPGNIISVNAVNGQTVKKGDIIVILEAMKMENEILSPRDGKIISVQVTKGQSVESNQVLVILE